MALPRNKLVPVLAVIGLVIVGFIIWKQVRGGPVKAGPEMTAIPDPGRPDSKALPADADSPAETMRTVVAANTELRRQVQSQMDENARLRSAIKGNRGDLDSLVREQVRAELEKARPAATEAAASAPARSIDPVDAAGAAATDPPRRKNVLDKLGDTFSQATDSAGQLVDQLKGRQGVLQGSDTASESQSRNAQAGRPRPEGVPGGLGYEDGAEPRSVTYKVFAPMGYAESKERGPNGQTGTLVRARLGAAPVAPQTAAVTQQPDVLANPRAEPPLVPFYTIPQNATLTRVTTMTSLIGRVPIDGKVTDPMQFKLLIGRENLAASGMFVPDEISGIVVSGIAIGDMAMSCSEGHIYSLTFVFEDGTIRTVNADSKGGSGGSSGGAGMSMGGGAGASGGSVNSGAAGGRRPLGYISDLWGNPCIAGRFVTNAPSYLTDIVGLRSLGVASRAYAAAQTSTTTNGVTGGDTTSVTGSRGAYVMGQAAAGATDEVTNWLLQRLKNSFDAVVTPAGQKVVVHIDQEIAIDKAPNGRRLDHRRLSSQAAREKGTGAPYGLD